ncbi:hypothetical protein [Streptomyces sp. NPDC056937]|uniref:hypothetical protein n=1 Tax=Streptomyces sp. NPDC056937 TaxID=3345969 RepID=UPI00362990C6
MAGRASRGTLLMFLTACGNRWPRLQRRLANTVGHGPGPLDVTGSLDTPGHGLAFNCAHPYEVQRSGAEGEFVFGRAETWRGGAAVTVSMTNTDRYGTATAQAWDRLQSVRLTRLSIDELGHWTTAP